MVSTEKFQHAAGELDVAALRNATPAAASLAFLNNAGSSLPTETTLERTIGHLRREALVGGYAAAEEVEPVLEGAKSAAARLINAADAHEISLQHSDTTAFVKVLTGMCNAGVIPRGGRIVVDRLAYSSHYLGVLQAAKVLGISIDVLPSDDDGAIDVSRIDSVLDIPTSMVAATMVGTHCGLVNDVAAVGTACRARAIPFVLDACQAVGQLPVDVEAIGCQALTTTGRKWLRGPRGTGFLYVHRSLAERCDPAGIDGHSAIWKSASDYELVGASGRFDEFECSFAARVGLANALDELESLSLARVHERVDMLARYLRAGLTANGATTHDGSGPTSGIVTFTVPGVGAADVVRAAIDRGISINTSGIGSARLDMAARGFDSVVRASPHVYNTTNELDRLLDVVSALHS